MAKKKTPGQEEAPAKKRTAGGGKASATKPKIVSATKARRAISKAITPPSPPADRMPAPKNRDVPLTEEELAKFRRDLLVLRDKFSATMSAAQQNVRHHNESDSDSVFEKFLAYERAGNTQEMILRIDEAIERIGDGTYGKCLMCQGPIRKVRLEVQPFSKFCIRCQEEMEKTKR